MRSIAVATAMILLFASAAGAQESPCIGKPIAACVAALAAAGHRDANPAETEREIGRLGAVDVNGKPVGPKLVSVFGYLPQFPGRDVMLEITVGAGGTVTSLDANLPGNPKLAHTAEEYDATGLFEVAALILGGDCLKAGKLDFYKFFENTMKPKIKTKNQAPDFSGGHAMTEVVLEKTPVVPFCGRKIVYANLIGYDTDEISADNPHGIFATPRCP
jgi:hypothetical protein